jgi:hypothetical protein
MKNQGAIIRIVLVLLIIGAGLDYLTFKQLQSWHTGLGLIIIFLPALVAVGRNHHWRKQLVTYTLAGALVAMAAGVAAAATGDLGALVSVSVLAIGGWIAAIVWAVKGRASLSVSQS